MPTAPNIDDPKYWRQRAKENRRLAERMPDEIVKQTNAERRGGVRQVRYKGIHLLPLRGCRQSRHRQREEELMLRECRLLAIADSLMRFGC
jgi:hypothetical protein